MFQDRKEYRKNFTSSGQLYFGGEALDFISHDVSVKGISIEVLPGLLLSSFADFEACLAETSNAEIFVKDLMLTGEAEIIWLRQENGKTLMGLEFKDVIYNAEKIWLKRQYYRKQQQFSGYMSLKNKRIEFEGKNVSVDGLMIYLVQGDESLIPGVVVKLFSEGLNIRALAKVCWVKSEISGQGQLMGLRYLSSE